MYGHEVLGWGYPLGFIGMALLWTAAIVAIVALVRYATGPRRQAGPPGGGTPGGGTPDRGPGPERLLAERFARGEITEDAYRRDLATLRGD